MLLIFSSISFLFLMGAGTRLGRLGVEWHELDAKGRRVLVYCSVFRRSVISAALNGCAHACAERAASADRGATTLGALSLFSMQIPRFGTR